MARILVVDDEESIRRIFRRILEHQRHEVEVAADGAQALAACRARRPDVVVTDLHMPVKNGIDLLEELSRDYPGLRCVVVTGGFSPPLAVALLELLAKAQGNGSLQVLYKPLGAAELVAAVAIALAAGATAAA